MNQQDELEARFARWQQSYEEYQRLLEDFYERQSCIKQRIADLEQSQQELERLWSRRLRMNLIQKRS